jgi:outer membrane lipoprotein-sorting protein
MNLRPFCSLAIAFAAAAACILPNGAAAAAQTITSGDQVVRAMHDRYQSTWYHTLTFTQKTTRRTPADTMVVETWYESAAVPGRLRIDIAPRPGGRSIIFANDSIVVTRGDSVLRRVAGRNPLLILGFDVYGQSPERTMEVLRAEGFNLAPVHEDTWKGRKVYVVGANAGDLHSKQFWVDRERLLFVRLLEPSRADSTKMDDTRFDDYQRLGGGWIAPTVESYSGGKLVQREEYRDIKANPPLPAGLFTAGGTSGP